MRKCAGQRVSGRKSVAVAVIPRAASVEGGGGDFAEGTTAVSGSAATILLPNSEGRSRDRQAPGASTVAAVEGGIVAIAGDRTAGS